MKTQPVPDRAFVGLSALAGLAFGVAAGLALFAALRYEERITPRAFDAPSWLDERRSANIDSHGHTPRQAMALDLTERVLRAGSTRSDVRALLGPPERWPIFDERPWFSREDEARWLGATDGTFAIGYDWLFLDFDERDVLVRWRIVNSYE